MEKKKIRLGHVGTLHDHSIGVLRCAHKLSDTFEIVGIVAEDDERRREIQQEHPYSEYPFMSEEELLNRGCDAVLVEGFEYDNVFAAKRFIDKGIAVHIDKPAGRDIDVFEASMKTAKQNHVPVQMGYMYRYNSAITRCMEMVKNGELGDIKSVTAIMNTGHPLDKQQWLDRFKGGIMFFLGCHMIDLIYHIQGRPNNITPFIHQENIDGILTENQTTSVFRYDNGISIAQANSFEINGYGRRQLVVCGSKGTFEIRPLEREPHVFYTPIENAETFQDRRQELIFPGVPDECRYDEMMMDFAAMIRGEAENPYSYEYEVELQKIILACCGYDVDYRTPTVL